MGPQGPQGIQGEQGIQGVPGIDGADGQTVEVATFTSAGDVATFTGTMRYYFESAGTITVARASLGTAGSTTTTVVVKKNGSTLSTLNLTSASNTTTTAPSAAVAAGDYLTVDVTAAGTGAKDLVVTVRTEA